MTTVQPLMSPNEIAERAKRIYADKFRETYEGSHDGEFLAVDVNSEEAYPGKYPEDAMNAADQAAPDGTFYLIRIGRETAFDMGFTGGQRHILDRALRRRAHGNAGLQPAQNFG